MAVRNRSRGIEGFDEICNSAQVSFNILGTAIASSTFLLPDHKIPKADAHEKDGHGRCFIAQHTLSAQVAI